MPRLYLTNDSYPELRDVAPQWARTVTWWKAILRAFGEMRFWAFLASQAACFLALAVSVAAIYDAFDFRVRTFFLGIAVLAWLSTFAYLQVSWGGDLMRSHLRAVSPIARHACPNCGHSLVGHLESGAAAAPATIRCPECGATISRDLFEPPYRIPRRFRAFPPWGGASFNSPSPNGP